MGAVEEEQETFNKKVPNILIDKSESLDLNHRRFVRDSHSARSSCSIERHSRYFAKDHVSKKIVEPPLGDTDNTIQSLSPRRL